MSTNVLSTDVRDKLITLDEVRNRLTSTEPLTQRPVTKTDKVVFTYEPTWALELDAMSGTDIVNAHVRVNGVEHQLTKEAALQAGAEFGITGALSKRLPSPLLEQNVNYFFSHLGEKEFNMLAVGDDEIVSAFTRPNIRPFSNIELMDNTLEGIEKHFAGTEVLADYKFNHSLVGTDIRLILPEYTREITNSGTDDDVWSAGIHLTNSLTGKKQTSVEGYMFRWFCTNGCTTELKSVGKWSRKKSQDEADVYDWAKNSVDEILAGMEGAFDRVQALTRLDLGTNTADVLRAVFEDYKLPVTQRKQIIDNMVNAESLTMYELQQAITVLANFPEVDSVRADQLMRIGGNILEDRFDTLKAQLWREGHAADAAAFNPYELQAVL